MYNLFVVYHKQKNKGCLLDNFFQEENENSIGQNFMPPEGEDIEFDENIDIDAIQKILRQHMDENASATAEKPEVETEDEEEDEAFSPEEAVETLPEVVNFQPPQDESTDIDPKAKKYVIYINPENIEFIEKLSIAERKLIINKLLREQDELIAKQKREEEIKRYLRHSIVAALTVIIGLPILFILVNRSLEVTIANYKRAQQNFSTLYREQGKIKHVTPSSSENFKY